MQTETPNQQAISAPTTPEIAPAGDSKPIKKQHGGKRAGAGRKPNQVKRLIGRLSPLSVGQILDGIDVEGTIAEIMKGSSGVGAPEGVECRPWRGKREMADAALEKEILFLKIVIAVLAVIVIAEGAALAFRTPGNRFKQIDEDGYIALDTATGQLCVTVKRFTPSQSPEPSQRALTIREMPACKDLR